MVDNQGEGKPRPYTTRQWLTISYRVGTGLVPALVTIAVALASLLYLLFPAAGAARADGGAPNLAYISGTAKGISVVDIQQKAVTGTFSLSGDPGPFI